MQLAAEHPELELVRQTSLAALPEIPLPDAIVIDGDHNYYTVSEELRLIGERAPGAELPLLLFHDVRWPHGRRDDYFDAEQIPDEATATRWPARCRGLYPGRPRGARGGLPYPRSAAHEGGPGNGVLTAIEDFVGRARGRAPGRGAGLLRLRRGVAHRALVGAERGTDPRSVRPRTRCSSAWRPTASVSWRGGTRPASSCGAPRSASRARRWCWTGCSIPARSRSPSGCRGCGPGPASRPSSRSSPRRRSAGRSRTSGLGTGGRRDRPACGSVAVASLRRLAADAVELAQRSGQPPGGALGLLPRVDARARARGHRA